MSKNARSLSELTTTVDELSAVVDRLEAQSCAPASPAPQPCPSCGRCPTCGRGGYQTYPYPYGPYRFWWSTAQPGVTYVSTAGATSQQFETRARALPAGSTY